jgi:hypothetical protein
MTSRESTDSDRAASEESILASLLDELTEALRHGRQPDVEQVANRHPALADDLRMLWATVWIAEEMAKAGPRDLEPAAEHGTALETFNWPQTTEPCAAQGAGGWN